MTNLLNELRYFTGSKTLFRHPLFRGFLYTEGVQYLAKEAGAYWLIDYIFSSQILSVLQGQSFQVWKVTVRDDHSARLTVEDRNKTVLTTFVLEFTDFPLTEFSLWLVDKTLLLPGEY